MKSFRTRFTMRRMMAAVAVLGINIGLVRAYALAEIEGQHLGEVNFGFFAFFMLQLGLWCYLRTGGRHRRFWLGFEVSGLTATMVMACLVLVERFNGVVLWYGDAMLELTYRCLPIDVDSFLENDHPELWGAIILFLPELLAALFGGLVAACLFRRTPAEEQVIGPPPRHLTSVCET